MTFSTEKPELFREMADSRATAGKVQDEPGTSYCERKQGNSQRMMGIYQKDADASLKGIPQANKQ